MIENEKKHWCLVLERLFAIVLMLAERSLPFRGHREQLYQPNNGNFLAQVELIAKFDPVMLEHLKRIKNKECFDTYLGKDVQNEIIELISRRILKTIVSSVQSSKYFSVIMDCTPDVSHKEQLLILLRCVKINQEEVQMEEFFSGFFHITDSTGSGLVETFLNLLAEYNLDLMNCRGQSYDNGANMRGQYKGVQALIKEKNPRALYAPCANHTFNLMVCGAAKSVSIAINFFGTVQRIFTFFTASTVQWDILQSVCKMTVISLSDTRWESRINSIKVVKDNLVQIIEALYKVADSSSIGVAVSEANGLANEISSYQFILSLTIWHDLLFEINKVSKVMQTPSADISIMIKLVETTKIFLESFRSDESFEAIIKKSKEIAIKLGTEPVFPQVRLSRKRRFFEYEGTDTPLNGKSKYKVDFFNAIIDVALVSLNERFKVLDSYNKIIGFLTRTEKMRSLDANELLNDCKNLVISLRDPSTEESDVNHEELYSEINTFLRMEASAESKAINKFGKIFPNLFIALRILLTSPISVASAERSFSKLKLIKNYLRYTMGQGRLSALALISIENKISRSLDCSDLIDEFASLKVRKVKF
ncbi:zinc finger MYM-type protein 1-like [Hydra vulgaris]|uniref:Zinc finger MYM-type protein 1-like n=1 Tax=Hydra vulgaris TaxID=6087 RepID=A0ABM4BUJ1_HYDVU